jgi:hypothetical protein
MCRSSRSSSRASSGSLEDRTDRARGSRRGQGCFLLTLGELTGTGSECTREVPVPIDPPTLPGKQAVPVDPPTLPGKQAVPVDPPTLPGKRGQAQAEYSPSQSPFPRPSKNETALSVDQSPMVATVEFRYDPAQGSSENQNGRRSILDGASFAMIDHPASTRVWLRRIVAIAIGLAAIGEVGRRSMPVIRQEIGLHLALRAIEANRLDDAESQLDFLISEYPRDTRPRLALVCVCRLEGRITEAEEALQRAVELGLSRQEAQREHGLLKEWIERGQPIEATVNSAGEARSY